MADFQKSAEQALGKVAKTALDNPIVTGSITRVLEGRERAVAAQEVVFSGLNLPSAADIERLTRRVRSISQRLEGIEDQLDSQGHRTEQRLAKIEAQLAEIAAALAATPPAKKR